MISMNDESTTNVREQLAEQAFDHGGVSRAEYAPGAGDVHLTVDGSSVSTIGHLERVADEFDADIILKAIGGEAIATLAVGGDDR